MSNKSPLWEAVKEAGRCTILLTASIFVSALADRLVVMPDQDIFIVALVLVLRMIDKYLHEAHKEAKMGLPSKPSGLIPF